MSYPKALEGTPKIIFFTDFDGTITLQDTNDFITDNLGFGVERRRQLNKDCLDGVSTFRDTFREMLDSIKAPYSQCIELLKKNIRLDPHFKDFYLWAKSTGIPVIILSSGMRPIIRTLLSQLLGPEADEIDILCNEMVDRPGMNREEPGGWTIQYHDDSGFGHDKSLTIRPYREHFEKNLNEKRPTLLYAGDGVSDLSAARETDLLFAKKGKDLVAYCEREGVPFTLFEDWSSILQKTKEIYEGESSIKDLANDGLNEAQQ
ncbi:MAG: hypothetical protein GOMPHAMPRED_000289 [Gomphillus americanus]|uniref:Phosphoserine phosphatase n=1 Tax=Gomphillus americanus TaxID=1940652 RepID=A0A8H3I3R6_9LECA|nr:MAG: hypothetical protein GOMPHAMPRED_000289 [Gomphillus americanus]